MLNNIKWAYQRVVRGYDDRIYWGFDSYFIQMIPALKEFCENWLLFEYAELNPEKTKVMLKTLELITDYENPDMYTDKKFIKYSWINEDKKLAKLAKYFGQNINYYWD